MSNYQELMQIFALPRPSASVGEARTIRAIKQWLEQRGIAYTSQPFWLFPYSNELIGLWLLTSASLLSATAIFHWPWWMLLVVAILMAAVITNVVSGLPLAVWMIPTRGENLLITIEPPGLPAHQELVIASHYDSKTELFDHVTTGRLFRQLPRCIGLAIAVIVIGLLERVLLEPGILLQQIVWIAQIGLSLPILLVIGLVGLNLIPGRVIEQSSGAVDNGAACAVILGLAERLQQQPDLLGSTRITLALFGGEEVSMQGSLAYVRGRSWDLPTRAINLELLGQRGPYVIWQAEGNVLVSAATDTQVAAEITQAVAAVTGQAVHMIGGINSDGFSFVRHGIPTCTFGSYDPIQGGGGLHRPSDNLARVEIERLLETEAILCELIRPKH
jgi:hypothetical protein